VSAYRWFHAGLLAVPARKVGRLIVVDEPIGEAGPRGRTAVYARVSSAGQKADSALNGHRRKLLALLGDPSVHRIVVEHRGRLRRLGSEYVEAALAAIEDAEAP